jgi:DNA-binding NarL/FixJ family response regulator
VAQIDSITRIGERQSRAGAGMTAAPADFRHFHLAASSSAMALATPATELSRPPSVSAVAVGMRRTLTRREIEVLREIAMGNSTKQVAWKLGITFRTAACHRCHLMEKLGIHDIANLVRYAIREGFIQP